MTKIKAVSVYRHTVIVESWGKSNITGKRNWERKIKKSFDACLRKHFRKNPNPKETSRERPKSVRFKVFSCTVRKNPKSWTEWGIPLRFFIHSVANLRSNRRGPKLLEKVFLCKNISQCQKTERGDPLVSTSFVCHAKKTTFIVQSMGQKIFFGALKFCRTFGRTHLITSGVSKNIVTSTSWHPNTRSKIKKCASQHGRPGRSLKSEKKTKEDRKTRDPPRRHRKTRIVRHPKTSRSWNKAKPSVVPSDPEITRVWQKDEEYAIAVPMLPEAQNRWKQSRIPFQCYSVVFS